MAGGGGGRGLHHAPQGPLSRTLRTFWIWLDTRGANRLVQALMLLCVASIAWLYIQDRQQADCIVRYNEATAQVSRERTEATNADWTALDNLVRDIHDGKPFGQRAQDYLDTRERTLKQRAENPLTPPPSDYCS